MAGELRVGFGSLQAVVTALHDLARDLNTGQIDLFLLDWAGDPASHPAVAAPMRLFAEFAHDQYRDAIALLSGLSNRVDVAGVGYHHTDDVNADELNAYLRDSIFVPADQRTG